MRRYWTPSGSHWNDMAACLVARRIAREAMPGPEFEPVTFNCEDFYISPRPKGEDRDLISMANLWDYSHYDQPTPYLKKKSSIPENVYCPKTVIAGTSFIWSVLRFLDRYSVHRGKRFLLLLPHARAFPRQLAKTALQGRYRLGGGGICQRSDSTGSQHGLAADGRERFC